MSVFGNDFGGLGFEDESEKMASCIGNHNTLLLANHGILIACKDNYIQLTKVQLEGKKAMNYKEFLAGNNLSDWRIQNPPI